jgi:hypothetical protein
LNPQCWGAISSNSATCTTRPWRPQTH